jgi:hypothetical protein
MKHRALLLSIVIVLFSSTIYAQTYQADTVTVGSSSSASGMAGFSLTSTQNNRAARIPMRITSSTDSHIGNPAYERVTYLTIYQPRTSDPTGDAAVTTTNLPPTRATTSGNCDVSPYVCSGWELGDYAVSEYSTYSLAATAFGALASQVKPLAYGPLATPKQTYIVVAPTLGYWAQTP